MVEFAVLPKKYAKLPLQKGFDAFVQRSTMKLIGSGEVMTLKSGMKVIRAEFKTQQGLRVVRYFAKSAKNELFFVHLVPLRGGDDLERMLKNTLARVK